MCRAQSEARVYTDLVEAFEAKVQADTGHRQAAIDFLDGHEAKASLSREQGIQADLQEHAIKAPLTDVERFERALRAKVVEKAQGIDAGELEERSEREVHAYAAQHHQQQPMPKWHPGRER